MTGKHLNKIQTVSQDPESSMSYLNEVSDQDILTMALEQVMGFVHERLTGLLAVHSVLNITRIMNELVSCNALKVF